MEGENCAVLYRDASKRLKLLSIICEKWCLYSEKAARTPFRRVRSQKLALFKVCVPLSTIMLLSFISASHCVWYAADYNHSSCVVVLDHVCFSAAYLLTTWHPSCLSTFPNCSKNNTPVFSFCLKCSVTDSFNAELVIYWFVLRFQRKLKLKCHISFWASGLLRQNRQADTMLMLYAYRCGCSQYVIATSSLAACFFFSCLFFPFLFTSPLSFQVGPLRFKAGCHERRLNLGRSVYIYFLVLVFLCLCLMICISLIL